ncbi:MAG TPA: PadR family transcriptional regulator [Marmoricola sp.]|nr:PadR family transcriptional regulator [Marmoricola sp.]
MAANKGQTLELAVLGLLQDSPLHGYELRKRVNLLFGWSRLLSYGSLYPALKRMLRNRWIDEVANPSSSQRQRIVYQITPAGSEYFTAQMGDSGPASWEDDNFNLRFAFFSRTEVDVRMRILEGRRARLQERLDRAQRHAQAGGDRYVSELHRHSIESGERELRWLTDLIDAERSGSERRTSDGPTPEPQLRQATDS